METTRAVTVRGLKQGRTHLPQSAWVASEIAGGYRLQCGDAVLFAVNGGKPRLFKTLDAVKRALREMGITEFRVETLKLH